MPRYSAVPNLQRRGNIWYWRARLPGTLFHSDKPCCFSLSLRQSDRQKALYMAQKLNLIILDLKLHRTNFPMRKNSLNSIFKMELKRMDVLLERLSTSARLAGRSTEPSEVAFDRMIGWSYRLLEEFGTGMNLTLEEGCPGRKYLLEHNVPEDWFSWIAEHVRHNLQDVRPGTDAAFRQSLRQDMEKAGLSLDDPLNFERAAREIHRAKAEAFLNSREKYWPHVDEALVQPQPKARPVEVTPDQDVPDTTPAKTDSAVLSHSSQSDINSVAELNVLEAEDRTKPDGGDLPISELMDQFEILARNRLKQWTPETARDVRIVVRLFQEILQHQNVQTVAAIRQSHVAAFRDFLSLIPKDYGRSSRLRAMTAPQLQALSNLTLPRCVSSDEEDIAVPQLPVSDWIAIGVKWRKTGFRHERIHLIDMARHFNHQGTHFR